MRTRMHQLILLCVIVALMVLTFWAAFQRPNADTLIGALTAASHLAIVVLIVSLLRTKGDVAFRASLLSLVTGWLLFEGYVLWEFLTHAD